MLTGEDTLTRAGIDAVALKPSECDVSRARHLPVGTVTVDWEGREHLPARDALRALADEKAVRVTTPVRADGFGPLGDDSLYERIPREAGQVLVAGHPAYLADDEDAVLDAVGAYVARRKPVREALPSSATDSSDTPDAVDAATDGGATDAATGRAATDSTATGHTRDVLLGGARKYALVGSPREVRERTDALRAAGADTVVGYPARGLDAFLE